MANIDWDSFKSKVPESMWALIEPDFTAWRSEVEPTLEEQPNEYEPYKEVVEGLTPAQLKQARDFAEWYERDPKDFLEKIATHLGHDFNGTVEPNPGSTKPGEGEEELSPAIKRELEAMKQLVTSQSEFLVNQANLTKEEKAQAEWEQYFTALKDSNEDIWTPEVEKFVVSRIASGDTGEQAITELKKIMGTPNTPPPPAAIVGNELQAQIDQQFPGQQNTPQQNQPVSGAPIVIGAGDLPSNKRSITDLSDSEVTDLVAGIAKRYQEQGS